MLLTVSKVSKSYCPVTVLRDVSLSVGFGKRVGLVGAKGAGKTALPWIILGDEQPDSGSARPLRHYARSGYKRHVLCDT